MKGKFFLYIFLAIIILIAIFLIAKTFFIHENEEITEYIPQEEISEMQERYTLVTLYFQNKQAKDIMPEARLIDAKLLLDNPYETLVKLLLDGPKSEQLNSIIPEGTRILNARLEGNTAIIDFSKEFASNTNLDKNDEEKTVESIVKTLTELNEIDSVKILIEGKEEKKFKDVFVRNN